MDGLHAGRDLRRVGRAIIDPGRIDERASRLIAKKPIFIDDDDDEAEASGGDEIASVHGSGGSLDSFINDSSDFEPNLSASESSFKDSADDRSEVSVSKQHRAGSSSRPEPPITKKRKMSAEQKKSKRRRQKEQKRRRKEEAAAVLEAGPNTRAV